jgi:GH15 family glucan-1,4-alpha-glucosidase
MARPIVLSNGSLHVGINKFGEVHDFYYPHVGLENHSAAKNLRHRVGVWCDGQFSWFDDGNWQFSFDYHHSSLIGKMRAVHEGLGIVIESDDFVSSEYDAFLRNIHIINQREHEREIRLFLHQVFNISDNAGYGDTAQFLPEKDAILHYRGRRAFIIGGIQNHTRKPFDQHSIGLFGIEGHQGTYRDAEDGELAGNNVEHGRVDSTVQFSLIVSAHESARITYWVTAAQSVKKAIAIHDTIIENGLLKLLLTTQSRWHTWLQPAHSFINTLPADVQDSFTKSLLLIKSHIDKDGAIIASTDTTMLNYSRDAYAYCWPRDGAFAIWPLIRLGFTDDPKMFFNFCRAVLHADGYLMHKYQPNRALGSSWHPYVHRGGVIAPPIQVDETAVVLFMFAQLYTRDHDKALLREYYTTFIVPIARFLSGYIDETTGLPKPSYDLWEEQFLSTTYTTAAVYGALSVAADMAEDVKDQSNAVRWRTIAEDIRNAAHIQLYNKDRQSFYKGLRIIDTLVEPVDTIDVSAVYGSYIFNLFDIESEELKNSVQSVYTHLLIKDMPDIKGFARYENDNYYRTNDSYPGNPWFITALWLAQYHLDSNETDKADELISWCRHNMLLSGVLAEQLNPDTSRFSSVAPLTWSQAEYVNTLIDRHSTS